MATVSNKTPIKSFAEDLTKEQRLRFAEVANRADEQRQKRIANNKRWQQKHKTDKNNKKKLSLWQWVNNVFFSLSPR